VLIRPAAGATHPRITAGTSRTHRAANGCDASNWPRPRSEWESSPAWSWVGGRAPHRSGLPIRTRRRASSSTSRQHPSTCPGGAVKLSSDTFKALAPRTTPKPARTPAASPSPEVGTTTITGDNFNPFSAVLVTFDAGPGGLPQSFEAQTDVFGHFSRTIQVV